VPQDVKDVDARFLQVVRDQQLRASRFIATGSLLLTSAQLLAVTGAFFILTLHDLPPSCRSNARPRQDLYSTNSDHVCFVPACESCIAMPADCCTVYLHKPAIFLTSVLLPASLDQTFRVHSPSHLKLCASSSNGFFSRGLGLRILVSGLLMPRTGPCYFERTLHTALAKSILAIPPHHLTFKDGSLAETLKKPYRSRNSFLGRCCGGCNTQLLSCLLLSGWLWLSVLPTDISVGCSDRPQLVSNMPTKLYRIQDCSTVPEVSGRSETFQSGTPCPTARFDLHSCLCCCTCVRIASSPVNICPVLGLSIPTTW
jgi:hypothetical protein